MTRICLLALCAFFAAAVCSSPMTAQESDSCKKCSSFNSIQFGLAGVDLKLLDSEQDESSGTDSATENNVISIQLECETGIPFLSSLPVFGHTFKCAQNEECEVVRLEAKTDDCCEGSCSEGCCAVTAKCGTCCEDNEGKCCANATKNELTCTKSCDGACCREGTGEIEFRVVERGIPFLSKVPHVNRLFKNVGIEKVACQERCPACPAERAKSIAVEHANEVECKSPLDGANKSYVRLVNHNVEPPATTEWSRDQIMHELMEARIENARLEAKLEAMEEQMELIEELSHVHAENAALKAHLGWLQKNRAKPDSAAK